jgi:hypothetical protein
MNVLRRAEIERRLGLDPDGFVPPMEAGERAALETAKQLGEWHKTLNSSRDPLSDWDMLAWLKAAALVNEWVEGK